MKRADSSPVGTSRIGRGRMTFERMEGPPISVPVPRRRAARTGYRYVARRLSVHIVRRPCEDEAEQVFEERHRDRADPLPGCGGRFARRRHDAASSLAAVAAQVPDYEAGGMEPRSWYLAIGGDRITLQWTGGRPVSARLPRRSALPDGYLYSTSGLTVLVEHHPCEEDAGHRQADTVTVFAGDVRFEGCGGGFLTPDPWNMPLGRIRRPDG